MLISIYEQEVHGRTHWRTMRDDGLRLDDSLQIDFPTEQDALAFIRAWSRRGGGFRCKVRVHYIDRQANGRRQIVKELET